MTGRRYGPAPTMRALCLSLAAFCACSSGSDEPAASPAPLLPADMSVSAPPSASNGAGSNAGGTSGAEPPTGGPGQAAALGSADSGVGANSAPGEQLPAPPAGPLPDLTLDGAYLTDTTIEDRIQTDDVCLLNEGCITGLGERRVVRFGSRMGNLGTAPFTLGAPDENNPLWTSDSCHGGYDLVGFAHYELLDASGAVVLTGAKNAYCIRDSEPWQYEGGADCYAYNCVGQGISPGCADNYGSELQCQWVDITGVPAGAYTLRVLVNASRAIPELDYANNSVDVSLQISDEAVLVTR